jgi:predicted nucleic acid-binding protein
VRDELQSPKRPGTVRAFVATPPEWLEVRAPTALEPIPDLHAGETAAISLARECHTELLVIDETQGRKAASELVLTVTGTIGVLEAAAKRNLVCLEDEFERLKRMGFWVNPKLLDARLALFREGRHEPETAAGRDQGAQQPDENERNRDRRREQ